MSKEQVAEMFAAAQRMDIVTQQRRRLQSGSELNVQPYKLNRQTIENSVR